MGFVPEAVWWDRIVRNIYASFLYLSFLVSYILLLLLASVRIIFRENCVGELLFASVSCYMSVYLSFMMIFAKSEKYYSCVIGR